MGNYKIKKGLDLKIAGTADKSLKPSPRPRTLAVSPVEFQGVKPKLSIKEGDVVKGGEPLFFDKKNPYIKFVSPVAGKVTSIKYGERRSLQSIVIETDWDGKYVSFDKKSSDDIDKMSREDIISLLHESGQFAAFRQRPFNSIPDSSRAPKSIFVNGMNTAPNAGDPAFILKDRTDDLQLGLKILKKLTDGDVNLCYSADDKIGTFKNLKGANLHTFSGPHPSGLVGTHIHFIDPIRSGDIVWHLDAVQLAELGDFLKNGQINPKRTICLAGSGIKETKYVESYIGASVESIIQDSLINDNQRIVNGTVLFGNTVEKSGHIGYFESNVQVLSEGNTQEFMGWAMLGLKRFSASSRVFLSSILPKKVWDFTTNIRGGHRTIVWTDVYDQVMPLDIYTNFLVKAILAEDIEETEALGILEVSDEDFALATYICPSKIDISSIIKNGLDVIEKEGY